MSLMVQALRIFYSDPAPNKELPQTRGAAGSCDVGNGCPQLEIPVVPY